MHRQVLICLVLDNNYQSLRVDLLFGGNAFLPQNQLYLLDLITLCDASESSH